MAYQPPAVSKSRRLLVVASGAVLPPSIMSDGRAGFLVFDGGVIPPTPLPMFVSMMVTT